MHQPAYWRPSEWVLGNCWVRVEDAASRGAGSLLHPPQTVLYSVDDRGCDPLVSTHTMKVGVGVGVGVEVGVGVGVSRADWSFKHIAPDTARR